MRCAYNRPKTTAICVEYKSQCFLIREGLSEQLTVNLICTKWSGTATADKIEEASQLLSLAEVHHREHRQSTEYN